MLYLNQNDPAITQKLSESHKHDVSVSKVSKSKYQLFQVYLNHEYCLKLFISLTFCLDHNGSYQILLIPIVIISVTTFCELDFYHNQNLSQACQAENLFGHHKNCRNMLSNVTLHLKSIMLKTSSHLQFSNVNESKHQIFLVQRAESH